MQTLFDQVARLVEQEFYDVTFLDERWPTIKTALGERYGAANGVEAREAVLGELLQSLGVSHAVLITPALAAYIAEQEVAPDALRPQITTYGSTVVARIRSCDENRDHQPEVEAMRRHHYLEYRTRPVAGKPFGGRLTVVIDERCYSCGEILAQAFKERTRATLVGAPTAGFVAAAMEHELTDGYGVVLPFAEMRSGHDQLLEGRGVEPHLPLAVSDLDDEELLRALAALDLRP